MLLHCQRIASSASAETSTDPGTNLANIWFYTECTKLRGTEFDLSASFLILLPPSHCIMQRDAVEMHTQTDNATYKYQSVFIYLEALASKLSKKAK